MLWFRVSLLSTGAGQGTSGCPTDGINPNTGLAYKLRVFGLRFNPDLATSVNVGSWVSRSVVVFNNTYLEFELPVGAGTARSVIVTQNSAFSAPMNLVSYAAPNITTVSGCADGNTNCERNGTDILTITGFNFGRGAAKVIVGGEECLNVTHFSGSPHTRLTCRVPQGVGYRRTVLVVQADGDISRGASELSYRPCDKGFYSEGNNITCVPCQTGRYSNLVAQPFCLDCPVGTYANETQQTICQKCEQGKFNNNTQQTQCVPCGQGTFAGADGLVNCVPCPVGKAFNGIGAIACTDCDSGKYQDETGTTQCKPCPNGTAVDFGGQFSCPDCKPGFYSPEPGRSTCLPCTQARRV